MALEPFTFLPNTKPSWEVIRSSPKSLFSERISRICYSGSQISLKMRNLKTKSLSKIPALRGERVQMFIWRADM